MFATCVSPATVTQRVESGEKPVLGGTEIYRRRDCRHVRRPRFICRSRVALMQGRPAMPSPCRGAARRTSARFRTMACSRQAPSSADWFEFGRSERREPRHGDALQLYDDGRQRESRRPAGIGREKLRRVDTLQRDDENRRRTCGARRNFVSFVRPDRRLRPNAPRRGVRAISVTKPGGASALGLPGSLRTRSVSLPGKRLARRNIAFREKRPTGARSARRCAGNQNQPVPRVFEHGAILSRQSRPGPDGDLERTVVRQQRVESHGFRLPRT